VNGETREDKANCHVRGQFLVLFHLEIKGDAQKRAAASFFDACVEFGNRGVVLGGWEREIEWKGWERDGFA
jgi:hypothetical protein